jgi:hypothetical protein
MKRLLLLLALLPALGACKQGHPISVNVNPEFQSIGDEGMLVYEKIAVFPFMSALYSADDPDRIAPRTMGAYFMEELNTRRDYRFISPNTVEYAVEQNGWTNRYREFVSSYPSSDEPDAALLSDLAKALQCDAFLVPVVDTWQKDEVDIQENASAATYVGATITIIDGSREPGKVLFRAVDEDYAEGARSETAGRSIVRVAGRVRSDTGAKSYAAPGFQDVAPRVARNLVTSLPPR